MKSIVPTQKRTPGEIASLRGFLCLLALAVTVKPLANEIANHICYDRHKDSDEDLHCTHLLSVARLEKGSTDILPALDTLRKPITKKAPPPRP